MWKLRLILSKCRKLLIISEFNRNYYGFGKTSLYAYYITYYANFTDVNENVQIFYK